MQVASSKPTAPRTELMKRLTSLAESKRIYVYAPAGYGKSFSVNMWARGSGKPYSRIALTEDIGASLSLFCESFAVALLRLQQDNKDLREIVKHPAFSNAPIEFTIRAIQAFADGGAESVLILDDLHLVSNDELRNKLPSLIGLLPDNITLFLLSRRPPPDSFSDLVVKDNISVMDAAPLAFESDEIQSLFDAWGISLTQKQAQDIYTSTGGWAIGVKTILLSGGQPSAKKLVERHWEAFIQKEVWEKWDECTRAFMMKISIADSLTPELTAALTGEKDSAETLDRLTDESAFISSDGEGTYYFHHLFQAFLNRMLERESKKIRSGIYKRAGDFFYSQKDYFKSVKYYLRSGETGGIAKGLRKMYDYNSPYAAIEDTLSIIRMSVDNSIVDKHPFLLEVQAWAAFVEGRVEDMERYLDRYYKLFPKILLQNPASAQTRYMLRCMDYRLSLIHVSKSMKKLPLRYLAKAGTPTITMNLPFFHRASRDFTEYLTDTDKNILLLRKTIGMLVGDEYDIMENCIRAGLHYERGDMAKAHICALEANAKIRDGFAPEVKFCAMMILVEIHNAMGMEENMQRALDNVTAMIEENRAYYLGANLQAYLCRRKLEDSDEDAAKKWLRKTAVGVYDTLSFFKLYQHFTTARAHIALGDFATAILFIKRLLALCEAYHRPLDVIETKILLSITFWKKGRGYQTEALGFMTDAIISANVYGYTQVFANEGAELVNMLQRLMKVASQKDYAGTLPGTFVKMLYIAALAQSKTAKGLTGGRVTGVLKFTEPQMVVMRLLCDGLTRNEIAGRIGITPYGVRSHLKSIYKKLDVPGGVEAAMKIKELGLLDG
ncbi:MAG: LuxR C-terminal-related transcriptional regulator [Oscillospiraceae bacterium]|nr:LuxR C-terminal-related transcriptional regulator [Oscillospiraceae bacterium]